MTKEVDVAALLTAAVAELGGHTRVGQEQMAQAVAEAISQDSTVVVQAGTGTGKSLGYLVPAVAAAVRTGKRAVVSTATLTLQRQVITRDLPIVTGALSAELGRQAKFAVLKGRGNYLCKQKLAGGYPQDDDGAALAGDLFSAAGTDFGQQEDDKLSRLGQEINRIRTWAEETTTGDRDDLVPGVSDRAWRQVSVTGLQCLRDKCPMAAECFAEAARDKADQSDIVITNHAMLGITAAGNAGLLPEHEVLIVDEAHDLVNSVTGQSTQYLSGGSVHAVVRAATRAGVNTVNLSDAAGAVERALAVVNAQRLVNGMRSGAPGVRELWTAVSELNVQARLAFSELAEIIKSLPATNGVVTDPTLRSACHVAQGELDELVLVTERVEMSLDSDVIWISIDENTGNRALRIAPLDVRGSIASRLIQERACVFTSATLKLGGSFDRIATDLGLNFDPELTPWSALDVGSPFEFGKQGICYVASDLPAPGAVSALEYQLPRMQELISAAGGRTLGLFTSERAAREAAEALQEVLEVPILTQWDDQLPNVLQKFAEHENSSLFGTLSLWQGVDVPGPACSLVLIDRIPFPHIADPISNARKDAVDAAGGNGFMQINVARAALLMAQGAGRLIRSEADRGVVAVLDSRFRKKSYGQYIKKTLPEFWYTEDLDTVLSSLAKLAAARPQ